MIQSASITKLAPALLAAKANITNPKKASANPFFKSKYANLGSVIDCSEDALAEQGLFVTQIVCVEPNSGKDALLTLLIHSSGEHIGGYYVLNPLKSDPQGIGSAITYARRYALQSLLGMNAEDDDGAAASGTTAPAFKPKAPPAADQLAAQLAASAAKGAK